jgi:hypothetical protein
MNFFIDNMNREAITSILMNHYKDFSYIKYILSLDSEKGFKMYFDCIRDINNNVIKEDKNKCWDIYLIQIQNGYKGSFDDFYNQGVNKSKNKNMKHEERKEDNKRILKEVEEMRKNAKWKKVR